MTKLRLRLKYALARRKRFVTARTDRFVLHLDTQCADDVGQALNLRKRIERRQWEPAFLDACFSHIRPDETIVEIGTWIGPYSVLLGKYIAPRGRVIGFEPDPVAFRQCVLNLNLNGVRNVFVAPLAISDKTGTVALYTNRNFGNSGSSILLENPSVVEGEKEKVDVPCSTLDQYLAALGIRPTTVKMDIEGAEDMALAGADGVLAEPGVKIFLEVHHAHLERRHKSANTILRTLADTGRNLYFLENDPAYPYRMLEKMDPARPITVPNFHVLAM